MEIVVNPDKEYTNMIRQKIQDNNGHCPCQLPETEDTKCMCKEFRDMIAKGRPCSCHCGLYILID